MKRWPGSPTPARLTVDEVIREVESVGGVNGVHNVHLRTPCSNIKVLDAHVYCCETDGRRFEEIKAEIIMPAGKVPHTALDPGV